MTKQFVCCLWLLPSLAFGHIQSMDADTTKPAFSIQQLSIGFNVGTASMLGLDLRYQWTPKWAVRLGYSYFSYQNENMDYTMLVNQANQNISKSFALETKINTTHIDLLGEYTLGWNGKFRAVAGLSYIPNKQYVVGIRLKDQWQFNDALLNPEDVGSAQATFRFGSKISPYLGIGLGRLRLFHDQVHLGLDLGAWYMGTYSGSTLEMVPALLLKSNEDNIGNIEQNLNNAFYYRLYPNLNLRIAYSFH
jgi:opacity protein-like surface antigen